MKRLFVVAFLLTMNLTSLWADSLLSKNQSGEVRRISIAELKQLPSAQIITDSPWLSAQSTFEGPTLVTVAEYLGLPLDKLSLVALDDYFVEPRLIDIETYQPIVAHTINGQPMTKTQHGPLWLMWPYNDFPEINRDAYHLQAIWQLVRIDYLP